MQLTVISYCFVFCFKLQFVSFCTLGIGTSKKKAKHNAAISLLNQMGVLPALLNGQSSSANGLEICILNFYLHKKLAALFIQFCT